MPSQIDGVDETLFQLPCKLHITLGVMRIFSDTEEVHVDNMYIASASNGCVCVCKFIAYTDERG